MLEYIILILFVLIMSFIFFYKKRSQKSNIIYVLICFAMLLCISVLRFGVGYDYFMYTKGFFMMGMDGFSTLVYYDWEWGFTIMTKIIVFFTRDPRIYMAIIALICLSGPFYVICKYSKKVWLSVLLYINLYFFYCTLNYLRQSIAISITLFAYPFLVKRKILPYMGIVLLASAFHFTALIMIPVYFISNFKPSHKIPILYCFLILWVFISSIPMLNIVTDYVYEGYEESIFLTEGIDIIHLFMPTVVILTCVCFISKFAEYNPILVTYSNLLYFGYFFMVVMIKHAIFERFSYFTYIYVILYIPELTLFLDEIYKNHLNLKLRKLAKKTANQYTTEVADIIKKMGQTKKSVIDTLLGSTVNRYKKRRKIIAFGIIIAVVVITVSYNIYGLTSGDVGVHGVYPYKSWLYDFQELFGN